MRKYSLNYAVKLSVKCRQTLCATKPPPVGGGKVGALSNLLTQHPSNAYLH